MIDRQALRAFGQIDAFPRHDMFMMTSNQLRQFRAIAEEENLHRAAEKLYISTPALSKTLQNLESELGCSLFYRVQKRLFLNAYGKKLLEYAVKVCDLLDEAENYFSNLTKAPRYSILSLLTTHYYILFNRYQAENVGQYDLLTYDGSYRQHPLQYLLDRQVDGVLYYDAPEWEERGLSKFFVCKECYFVAAKQEHPLSWKQKIYLRDLAEHTFLCDQGYKPWLDWFEKKFGASLHACFYNSQSYQTIWRTSERPLIIVIGDVKLRGIKDYLRADDLLLPIIDADPQPLYLWHRAESVDLARELQNNVNLYRTDNSSRV